MEIDPLRTDGWTVVQVFEAKCVPWPVIITIILSAPGTSSTIGDNDGDADDDRDN